MNLLSQLSVVDECHSILFEVKSVPTRIEKTHHALLGVLDRLLKGGVGHFVVKSYHLVIEDAARTEEDVERVLTLDKLRRLFLILPEESEEDITAHLRGQLDGSHSRKGLHPLLVQLVLIPCFDSLCLSEEGVSEERVSGDPGRYVTDVESLVSVLRRAEVN